MRHIIRNIRNLFKCYTQSTIFNIVGLSLAFAVGYIIYVQTSYEFGYGKADANSERIYRAKSAMQDKWGATSFGIVSDAVAKHPDVEVMARYGHLTGNRKLKVNTTGEWQMVERYIACIDTSMNKIFDFDMVVGEFSAIENPGEVIIPMSMANEFFGGADKALTMQLRKDGAGDKTYTIAGVYRDFSKLSLLHQNKVYEKFIVEPSYKTSGNHAMFFKLREGGNISQITKISNTTITEMLDGYGLSSVSVEIDYTPISEVYFDKIEFTIHPTGNKTITLSLVFVGILVMIIAIINFVNFSIAHAPRRLKAMNTYRILGHSLAGLRALIVMEAVFIAVISSLGAILLIHYFEMTTLSNIIVTSIELGQNIDAVVALVVSAALVGIIAGVYPAFYITNFQPAVVLNGGKSLPHSAQIMRNFLVSLQYVISIAMIIIAMFITMQNNLLSSYNEGYNGDNLVVKVVSNKHNALKEHLLKNNTFIEAIEYSGSMIGTDKQSFGGMKVNFDNNRAINSLQFYITAKFVEFIGMEIIEGELFDTGDTGGNSIVAINQSAAEIFNLKIGDKLNNSEIKAIISNATLTSLRNGMSPMVFVIIPPEQARVMYVRYREGHFNETLKAIETSYAEILPESDATNIHGYDEFKENVYQAENNLGTIISWSAILSIIIAIIGVVGLISLEAQQRTREIAIRKACGATTAEILRMLNLKFIKIVSICFTVAAPVAYLVVRTWLSSMPYKVAITPLVFLGAGLLIMLITIVVVTLVSYRAANTNPAEAMK